MLLTQGVRKARRVLGVSVEKDDLQELARRGRWLVQAAIAEVARRD
jgi:hypothetical protein